MSPLEFTLIYLAGYCITLAVCLLYMKGYEDILVEIFGRYGYEFLSATASLLWPLLWLHWLYSRVFVDDSERVE